MKNIFKSFLVVAAFFAASCNPDGPVQNAEPQFPQSKEYNVAPGSTLDLNFNANMDWELSVPENSIQWFWIQDGTFKLYRVNGKAGDQTVTIGVSATEEFDVDRTCDVTLKMGGKEQVIAKLVRSAKEKTIALYTAVVVDGEIQFVEDGSAYLYNETEAESIELVWTGSDFRLPVMIEANHNWTVKTPEWAQIDVPEQGAGETALNIYGVPSEYPLDPAQGTVQFMSGDKVLKEYAISIPGCKDIFSYKMDMSISELEFNYADGCDSQLTDLNNMVIVPTSERVMSIKLKAIVPGGILKFSVEVQSDSESFNNALAAAGGAVIDLINPSAENDIIFQVVPFPHGADLLGQTEVAFDLSAAQGAITNYPGNHVFMMTIVDQSFCSKKIPVTMIVE